MAPTARQMLGTMAPPRRVSPAAHDTPSTERLRVQVVDDPPETTLDPATFERLRARFATPSDTAPAWDLAQHHAALVFDTRDRVSDMLLRCYGGPRLWPSASVRQSTELDALASAAVDVAAHGRPAPWRPWVELDALPDAVAPFAACLAWLPVHGPHANERSDPRDRLTLARLCDDAAQRLAECDAMRSLRNAVLHNEGPAPLALPEHQAMPPQVLLRALAEVRDMARHLATVGEEPTRGEARHGDRALQKLATICDALWNGLHHDGDLDDTTLPATMRVGGRGDLRRRYEQLAFALDALGEVEIQERAGVAFLLAAQTYRWGPARNEATSFATARRAVIDRVRASDEDTRPLIERHPVLRWKGVLNVALYALGHNADNLADSAARAALDATVNASSTRRR